MKRVILGGPIASILQPLQKGSVQFFLAPDDGGANIQGGVGGQGQQQQQGDASQTGGGNQQQQQGQPQAFVDPFANIDLDLLDPAARQTIVAARADMQRLHGEAQAGRTFQSQADRYKAELAKLQNQGQQQQQQVQPGQRDPSKPLSIEEEVYESLVNEFQMAPAEAKKLAPFQAKMLGILGSRTKTFVTNTMGPMADTVAQQQAESTFEGLVNDPNPQNSMWFSIPEVAEKTWAKVRENTAAGHDMPAGAIVNLAKIFYVDHHAANGNGQPLQLPIMQQQQQGQQQQQQSTGMRYPGAGAHTPRPQLRQRNSALDPDTAAAIAATKAGWATWNPAGRSQAQNVTRSA